MRFALCFTPTAIETLNELKHNSSLKKRHNAVKKVLKLLSENPRHPSLQTHQYYSIFEPDREKIFEAYAEQSTPGAYRIFFYYGPKRGEITVFAIMPHF